jgi:hypothetical protein
MMTSNATAQTWKWGKVDFGIGRLSKRSFFVFMQIRVTWPCRPSKKPSEAGHALDSIYSQIGIVDTGAGHVEVSEFDGESEVIPQKPVGANICLKVKLERQTS